MRVSTAGTRRSSTIPEEIVLDFDATDDPVHGDQEREFFHGADRATEIHAGTGNWIQPLDSGSFDVGALLDTLEDLGYRGPVGLQCYGIPGDARDHLTRSMAAWRRFTEKRKARTSGAKLP